jgi:molecular chaperone DnaJ
MAAKRDYYEVLGVQRTASLDEVRNAYRKLARQYHPDVNPGDATAEERFKEINEAQEILSDADRRARYDRFGHEEPGGPGGYDAAGGFGDIFNMFFSGGFPGQSGSDNGRDGRDLRVEVEITLEEAASGVEKSIQVSRHESCDVCRGTGAKPGTSPHRCPSCNGAGQVRHVQNTILGSFATVTPCPRCRGEGMIVTTPCQKCGGSGRIHQTRERMIRIPAGVDDGMHLQLQGEGDSGMRGGRGGDLYVQIHVKEHPVFKRRGMDLYAQIPFSFPQMTLGATVRVPTLTGTESLEIPAGTQPGTPFRMRGRGMPDVSGRRGPGDLQIIAGLRVPTRMTEDQKRALREFAALSPSEDRAGLEQDKGLLEKVIDHFK